MSTSATHLPVPAPEPVAFPTASQASATPTTPKKHRLGFSDVANMFIRLRRFSTRAGVTPKSSHSAQASSSEQQEAPAHIRNISTDMATNNAPPALTISSPSTSSPRSRIKIRRRSETMAPQLVGPYAYTRRVSAPKVFKQSKAGHISCTSGEPKTHPSLQGSALQDIVVAPMGSSEDVQNNNVNGPQTVETWDLYECSGGVNLGLLLRQTRKALMEYVDGLGANALTDEQWQSTICGPKSGGVYRIQIRYSAVPKRSRKPDPGRPVALDQAKGVPGLMSILKRNGEY